MSVTEILDELPKLLPMERERILHRIEELDEQAQMKLEAPSQLYVDGACVSAPALQQAQEQNRELMGPAPASPQRGQGFTVDRFDVQVEARRAGCPAGQISNQCSRLEEKKPAKSPTASSGTTPPVIPARCARNASAKIKPIGPSPSANIIPSCNPAVALRLFQRNQHLTFIAMSASFGSLR